MVVDPATAQNRVEHEGVDFYFCCAGCRTKFLADPARYLQAGAKAAAGGSTAGMPAEVPEGVVIAYTCPMHSRIRQQAPGSCPICGMALEPEGIPDPAGANPELKDMTRRFVIGAILAIPIFGLEMGAHLGLLAIDHDGSMLAAMWIQFILATPIVLWCGWSFFRRAWASVLNRSPNMFTLIAIGVGTAYGYSVMAMFAPGIFPAALRRNGVFVPVYYEAAAVVTVLVLLGQVLELMSPG